jgi:hypothetical protein
VRDALVERADELCDPIRETIPVSLAGVIALLEWNEIMVEPDIRDKCVAALRAIMEREARP